VSRGGGRGARVAGKGKELIIEQLADAWLQAGTGAGAVETLPDLQGRKLLPQVYSVFMTRSR
jgi:hypothetical protein